MRFTIFTHVIHREEENRFYAYSPYVREMNLWLKHVEEVEIVAPAPSRGSLIGEPYEHFNLIFTEIPAFNLLSIFAILKSVFKIPVIFFKILGAMRRADHLHLRCPGNIGLLAAIAQIFFPKKSKSVKYAGNWDPEAKQPWTYKLQKRILSNTFLSRNIQVLVYGDWPNQSQNIQPFFTASFSEKEKARIQKDFRSPYTFIFTGNLVKGKGIFEAIGLIEELNNKGVNSELNIYGDGILEDSLRDYIQEKELQGFIKLKGRKNLEELKQAYKKAHFVVLLSKSEGWPKAIAEGMWFGCIPIATPVSCVPGILGASEGGTGKITLGKRGVFLSDEILGKFQKNRQFESPDGSRDVSRTGFSKKDLSELISLIKTPEELNAMSLAAQEWSQEYTLEGFEKAIREILGKQNPQPKTHNSKLTADNNKQQTTNYKQLRVIQIVDTLNPGGAERMAVNLANALVGEIEASFLCCTREEGMLKNELGAEVGFLFLNKRNSFDLKAFWKLRKFIKAEEVNLVHAHGTSWFWGVLLKLSGFKLKLVWHDHSGANVDLNNIKLGFLRNCSRSFDGIISVNNALKAWAQKNLKSRAVIQLNNFIIVSNRGNSGAVLKGDSTDFKIVCVANLRPQKDHLNLLAAFEMLNIEKISLHLVGADPGSTYSKRIRKKIGESDKKIFYYGSIPNVFALLKQADLGILSSRSEGLPLALLEYGLMRIPVVCTEVGQNKKVVGNTAILVPANNPEALAKAISFYFYNIESRKKDAYGLHKRLKDAYSKESLLPVLSDFYKNLSKI